MKNKNQKKAYFFLAPAMIILTVFVFVPLVAAFIISFLHMDIYMKNISFAGFGNYFKSFETIMIPRETCLKYAILKRSMIS